MSEQEAKRNLKRLVHAFGLLLGVGLFAYVLYGARNELGTVLLSVFAPDKLPYLLVAIFLYVMAHVFLAAGWQISILAFGSQLGKKKAVEIYFLSTAGKYLPGNIAHHVGRLGLLKKSGVSLKVGVISSTYEIAQVIAISCVLTALFTPFSRELWGTLESAYERTQWIFILGAVSVAIVVVFALRVKLESLEFDITALRRLLLSKAKDFFVVAFFVCLGICFFSVGAAFVAVFLVDLPLEGFWDFASVFPLSWIAGTLTPGAPAGLGTREFVMSKLLSGAYPEVKVLTMVLTIRVVSILGDMAVFFIGLQLARNTSGNAAQGTDFTK